MQIIINESQLDTLLESQGVRTNVIDAAKMITNDIINNHLWDLYSEDDIDNDDDYYDDESIDGSIECDGVTYDYELSNFGNSSKKGSCDGYKVYINYEPIKKIIDRLNDIKKDNPNIKNVEEALNCQVYEELYPVLMHELTHLSTPDSPENQSNWIGQVGMYAENDVRETLYLFSENEMNARVSSAYAIVENDLDNGYFEEFSSGQEFKDYIDNFIIDNDAFLIRNMQAFIDSITNDKDYRDKKFLERTKGRGFKYNEVPYCLFKEDSRLRNNRKLNKLFNENYPAAMEQVKSFYQKQLDEYKKRLYKACWYAYTDVANKHKQVDGSRCLNEGFSGSEYADEVARHTDQIMKWKSQCDEMLNQDRQEELRYSINNNSFRVNDNFKINLKKYQKEGEYMQKKYINNFRVDVTYNYYPETDLNKNGINGTTVTKDDKSCKININFDSKATYDGIKEAILHELTHAIDTRLYSWKNGWGGDSSLKRYSFNVRDMAKNGLPEFAIMLLYHLWDTTEFNAWQANVNSTFGNSSNFMDRIMGFLEEANSNNDPEVWEQIKDYVSANNSVFFGGGYFGGERGKRTFDRTSVEDFKHYFIKTCFNKLKKFIKKAL